MEQTVGDLDVAYGRDRLAAVIRLLSYSRADEAAGLADRSGIRINGDIRTGLATLKQATGLYRDFRDNLSTRSGED